MAYLIVVLFSPIFYLILRMSFLLISRKWPEAKGEVIECEMATQTTYPPFYEIHGKNVVSWLKVKYKYKVDNKVYISKRISFEFGSKIYTSGDEIDSDALLKMVFSNNIVVYYFKYIPSISCLRNTFDMMNQISMYLILIVGFLVLYIVSFLIVYYL